MIEITTLILLFFSHWVADFVYQDESWALNKSHDNWALTAHVSVYSTVMWAASLFVLPVSVYAWGVYYVLIFATHWITDYFTSKWVGKKFKEKYLGGPVPNFGAFTVIGFDQFLHLTQIVLIYELATAF